MKDKQKTNKQWTYKIDDIFGTDIENPNDVFLQLPDEVIEEVGLQEGDTLRILRGDQGTIILEKMPMQEDSE